MAKGLSVVLFVVLNFGVVNFVDALQVEMARIYRGTLQVNGSKAKPGSVVSLDGVQAGNVKNNGHYSVSAVILPSDCIVEVTDGFDTQQAVVSFCSPQGPRGEKGEDGPVGPQGMHGQTGSVGPPGPVLHLYTANGEDKGILVNATSDRTYTTWDPETGELRNYTDSSSPPSHLSLSRAESLYYTDFNCHGMAYAKQPLGSDVYRDAEIDGGIKYFVDTGEVDTNIDSPSFTPNPLTECRHSIVNGEYLINHFSTMYRLREITNPPAFIIGY